MKINMYQVDLDETDRWYKVDKRFVVKFLWMRFKIRLVKYDQSDFRLYVVGRIFKSIYIFDDIKMQ